jgi:hypothetical protein
VTVVPISASGCSMRVAVTTTGASFCGWFSAAAGDATAVGAAVAPGDGSACAATIASITIEQDNMKTRIGRIHSSA